MHHFSGIRAIRCPVPVSVSGLAVGGDRQLGLSYFSMLLYIEHNSSLLTLPVFLPDHKLDYLQAKV